MSSDNELVDFKVGCGGDGDSDRVIETAIPLATSEENGTPEASNSNGHRTFPPMVDMLSLSSGSTTGDCKASLKPKPKALCLTASYISAQPIGGNYILNNLSMPLLNDYQFAGTYHRYPEFASLVQAFVDADSNLSDQSKYAALLKLTRGDANRYINDLLGPDQYQVAKQRLEYRYYRPILIQQSIIEEIVSRQSHLNSKHRIFRLIRISTDLDRALKLFQLLEADSKWMAKLLNTILHHLPYDIREQFSKEFKDNFTVESLFPFLNSIIEPLENMEFLEQERRRRN